MPDILTEIEHSKDAFSALFKDKNCLSIANSYIPEGSTPQQVIDETREMLWENRASVTTLLSVFSADNLSSILSRSYLNSPRVLSELAERIDDIKSLTVQGGGIFAPRNLATTLNNKRTNAPNMIDYLTTHHDKLTDISSHIDASTIAKRFKDTPFSRIESAMESLSDDVAEVQDKRQKWTDKDITREAFETLFTRPNLSNMARISAGKKEEEKDKLLEDTQSVLWEKRTSVQALLEVFEPKNISNMLSQVRLEPLPRALGDMVTVLPDVQKMMIAHGGIFSPSNISSILGSAGAHIEGAARDLCEQYDTLKRFELRGGGMFSADNIAGMLRGSGQHVNKAISDVEAGYDKLEKLSWRHGGPFTASNITSMINGARGKMDYVINTLTSEENLEKFSVIADVKDTDNIAITLRKVPCTKLQNAIDEMYNDVLAQHVSPETVVDGSDVSYPSKGRSRG